MKPRLDLLTASRVDLTLILLPMLTFAEAFQMLIDSGVPAEVAIRLLTKPETRRPVEVPTASLE